MKSIQKSEGTAIYCRVSTITQNSESQKRDLIDFATGQGWDVVKIYEEKKSGVSDDRKEFSRMLGDAGVGKFKRILIYDLSRLSRKGVSDTIGTIEYLRKVGVIIYSKSEGLSFDGQMGLVLASLFGAMSNIDYQMRREKQYLGIAGVRAKNGGKCYWGGNKRTRDESKDKSIIKLREGGLTIRAIAKDLRLSTSKVQDTVNIYIKKGLLIKGRQVS